MFTELKLKNFKSFRDFAFRPGMLNILTGLNGSGKSSLLQYLLMLREMSQRSMITPWLINLKEAPLSFGTYADLKYAYAQANDVGIEMSFRIKGSPEEYRLAIDDAEPDSEEVYVDLAKDLRTIDEDGHHAFMIGSNQHWQHMLRVIRSTQYMAAFRLPPQQEHEYSRVNIRTHKWGSMGEYAVAYLAEYGMKSIVMPALCHESEVDPHLRSQVDAWMGVISPGAHVAAENLPTINRAKLSVSFANGVNRRHFRPQNVGFGISYVLPILVMILRAQPGDCLIIENPEAHLHPRGQAEFGRLLSLAAANGVQLFVETHSDHVVNGIRVAVKRTVIDPSLVRVAFFCRKVTEIGDDYQQESKVNILNLADTGDFDCFPDGFMDEWSKQLLELIRP